MLQIIAKSTKIWGYMPLKTCRPSGAKMLSFSTQASQAQPGLTREGFAMLIIQQKVAALAGLMQLPLMDLRDSRDRDNALFVPTVPKVH